ncbi:nuclear transport factor 2 family protein [Nocardiopsis sp. FIRDI 009]|uniref:nuclear transport factor 2 family protein n=1 Tax=Nocardiopsis sp. FIRDI 009 TaxID=714197 RepID=UPI0013007D58|nr:nuclear transport factor 2 family protein [Nocardiopsis sp. FIRDI 009]
MTSHQTRKPELAPGARVQATGQEHARLFYHYLDTNDQDGCASLVDTDARFTLPGGRVARGPEEAARMVCVRFGGERSHRLHRVIAQGDGLAVTGRHAAPEDKSDPTLQTDFVDVFTITEHGLLLSWRRFHSVD